MTRRAWRLLVCGLVLVAAAAAGSVVLASRSSGEVAGPQISATLPDLSPTQWKTVKARLARRGFDRRNALIVGSSSMERPPFVLVAATPGGGRACFFAARGVRLGPATCPGRRSVVAFTLGIDSHTEVVAAVAGRSIVKFALAGRTGCGLGLLPPNVWNAVSFEGTFILDQGRHNRFLRGYDAAGRVVALAELPLPSSSLSAVHTTVARAVSLDPRTHPFSGCVTTSTTPDGIAPVLDP